MVRGTVGTRHSVVLGMCGGVGIWAAGGNVCFLHSAKPLESSAFRVDFLHNNSITCFLFFCFFLFYSDAVCSFVSCVGVDESVLMIF